MTLILYVIEGIDLFNVGFYFFEFKNICVEIILNEFYRMQFEKNSYYNIKAKRQFGGVNFSLVSLKTAVYKITTNRESQSYIFQAVKEKKIKL